MNIYINNLSYDFKEEELRELFANYGSVDTVSIIKDRLSGKNKGFAFVEMDNEKEAQEAIKALDGSTVGGRQLTVNEAQPRRERF